MTATIRAEVNGGFFAKVAARPDRIERARLERLLVVDPATRRSEFDRIKSPAQAATLGKFKQRLAHLQALDAIGPTEQWLNGVPPGKVSHFAGEARVAKVDDMRKTGEAKRLTLLVSLLHQQRVEARDEVVTMFCKRMAALHKKSRERLEELREAHRAESERLIGVFGEVLRSVAEAAGRRVGRPSPIPPTRSSTRDYSRVGGATLGQIAAKTGIPKTSLHRYLAEISAVAPDDVWCPGCQTAQPPGDVCVNCGESIPDLPVGPDHMERRRGG